MNIRSLTILTLSLALLPLAQAFAYTPPTLVNSTLVRGEPSCVGLGSGQAICAALSTWGTVIASRFNGTSWSAWRSLAGVVNSAPSCTEDGSGKVLCAARAANGQLQYALYDPPTDTWATPMKAGGALFSAPSCATLPKSRVLCAARAGNGGLTSSMFNGLSWTAFTSVAGQLVSGPACASDDNDGVVCMVVTPGTPTGGLSFIRHNGSVWGTFQSTDGQAWTDEVRCSSTESPGGSHRVFCHAVGANHSIHASAFNGSGWTAWEDLGLQSRYGVSCGVTAPGQLVCGGILADGNAYRLAVWNGSFWSPWLKLTTTGVGTPSCTGLGNGTVACLFHRLDSKMNYLVYP